MNRLDDAERDFYDALGIYEAPMGVCYTDIEPVSGISPKAQEPINRDAEEAQAVDWEAVLDKFSCVLSKVWIARRKATAAFFDKERFGCLGAAFYLGFMKPYLRMHPYFVSTGIPGVLEGERYVESPETAKQFLDTFDPAPAPARFLVIKPISQFVGDEYPDIVVFFARPEIICGLHGLTSFVTNDINAVQTPFGSGCSAVVTWPYKYKREGALKAVVGSFDPSCRRYLRPDEISFAVPLEIYQRMLERWQSSFITGKAWQNVTKKIRLSAKTWNQTGRLPEQTEW